MGLHQILTEAIQDSLQSQQIFWMVVHHEDINFQFRLHVLTFRRVGKVEHQGAISDGRIQFNAKAAMAAFGMAANDKLKRH